MIKPEPKRQETRFTDFKVNMDIHPVKRDLVLDTNENAIKRSIKNLLFTDRYERFFQPKLGGGLKDFLFENITDVTADNIKNRIIETIQIYEPRAILEYVSVTADPDNNKYTATIVFSTKNNPQPVEINTILERIR